jgi:hypothetical protein
MQGSKVKLTLWLPSDVAKYIRVASAQNEVTIGDFVSDVIEQYGRVESLDMEALRLVLAQVQGHNISVSDAGQAVLSTFGIEGGD